MTHRGVAAASRSRWRPSSPRPMQGTPAGTASQNRPVCDQSPRRLATHPADSRKEALKTDVRRIANSSQHPVKPPREAHELPGPASGRRDRETAPTAPGGLAPAGPERRVLAVPRQEVPTPQAESRVLAIPRQEVPTPRAERRVLAVLRSIRADQPPERRDVAAWRSIRADQPPERRDVAARRSNRASLACTSPEFSGRAHSPGSADRTNRRGAEAQRRWWRDGPWWWTRWHWGCHSFGSTGGGCRVERVPGRAPPWTPSRQPPPGPSTERQPLPSQRFHHFSPIIGSRRPLCVLCASAVPISRARSASRERGPDKTAEAQRRRGAEEMVAERTVVVGPREQRLPLLRRIGWRLPGGTGARA